MEINELWTAFKKASTLGEYGEALTLATRIVRAVGEGDVLPKDANRLTLSDWLLDNPKAQRPTPAAKVVFSINKELFWLSDYVLVYQDIGENLSILLPRQRVEP